MDLTDQEQNKLAGGHMRSVTEGVSFRITLFMKTRVGVVTNAKMITAGSSLSTS
jgi:hypothetical protein